ncbi:MAG: hypothetical protein OXI06_08785 [bacterium]|nr:hypothetical protein [bacterium]
MTVNQETAEWCGRNFYVYKPGGGWKDLPGVYIFVRLENDMWYPLYVGETESFSERPLSPGHEHWAEAVQLGMNQIHAVVVSGKDEGPRQDLEGAIYDLYKPQGHLQLNRKIPPGSKHARKQ